MNSKLKWKELLRRERFSPEGIYKSGAAHEDVGMLLFDTNRVIYTSSFRRMQGKTQVNPLPLTDYTRNRLTHSIEVSVIGRYLGLLVFDNIPLKERNDVFAVAKSHEIAEVISAACLAHDIGNPPFGHSGEEAIQAWFCDPSRSDLFEQVKEDKELSSDYTHYDGNAQGFRTLTRTQAWRNDGGLRLSYATMGAVIKYPNSSKHATAEKPKYGFFRSEMEYANRIFDHLGMLKIDEEKYCRHPLVYLTEAADDIAYKATDVEDAVKSGTISYKRGEELLIPIAESALGEKWKEFRNLAEADKIAYLRSGAISALIEAAVLRFRDKYKDIMNGIDLGNILESGKFKDEISTISKACHEEIYPERRKREIESSGFFIIFDLLDIFGGMLSRLEKGRKIGGKAQRLFDLFPKDRRMDPLEASQAEKLQLLVDFVSGMTDRYAIDTYQKIRGFKF